MTDVEIVIEPEMVNREYQEYQIYEWRHGLMRQQEALAAQIECADASLAELLHKEMSA